MCDGMTAYGFWVSCPSSPSPVNRPPTFATLLPPARPSTAPKIQNKTPVGHINYAHTRMWSAHIYAADVTDRGFYSLKVISPHIRGICSEMSIIIIIIIITDACSLTHSPRAAHPSLDLPPRHLPHRPPRRPHTSMCAFSRPLGYPEVSTVSFYYYDRTKTHPFFSFPALPQTPNDPPHVKGSVVNHHGRILHVDAQQSVKCSETGA